MDGKVDKGKVYPDKENSDDIYDKEDVEEQMDNDEIDPQEAGFMEGYDNPNLIKCKKCGKKVKNEDGVDLEKCHEKEDAEGNVYLLCDCCEE